MLLYYATVPCVSIKGYYTQIPMGWVRSQHVRLMQRGRATQLSDCDVWEVIPWCLPLYYSTHTDTPKRPHAALSDMNPPDLSAPANRIVAPGMTAEPLSLSWLLSVETHHMYTKHTTHTCHYISATTAVQHQHQHQLPRATWIYLFVSLLASQLNRTRRSGGLVT